MNKYIYLYMYIPYIYNTYMVYILYIWYSKEDIMTIMKIIKTMYFPPRLSQWVCLKSCTWAHDA